MLVPALMMRLVYGASGLLGRSAQGTLVKKIEDHEFPSRVVAFEQKRPLETVRLRQRVKLVRE